MTRDETILTCLLLAAMTATLIIAAFYLPGSTRGDVQAQGENGTTAKTVVVTTQGQTSTISIAPGCEIIDIGAPGNCAKEASP